MPTGPNRATRRAMKRKKNPNHAVRPERRKNLSTSEAAAYLNISVRTLHNWLREGIIEGHRCGPRLLRFNADELDEAVNRL
jgi:excisionase family DNA binding protein